jgi:SSS family solute:Na+ symporter
MTIQRVPLLDLLVDELHKNTGFVRIHAAEAAIDHGYSFKLSALFEAEFATAAAPYRIGVWRVQARMAEGDAQRHRFVELLRRAMLDPEGPDRLHAAESLAKLGWVNRSDRSAIEQWLATTADAAAPFLLWLLLLSGTPAERPEDEARLARLIDSSDPMTRLRAAFAIGRLDAPSSATLARLSSRLEFEADDSSARVHLLSAALLHAARSSPTAATLKRQLIACLGACGPAEQFEVATVLGCCGSLEDLPVLVSLLESGDADARIGAAGALLHLLP